MIGDEPYNTGKDLKPLDLIRGLGLVFLEGSLLQVFRLGSVRHLRKSGEDLLFGRSRCLSGSRERSNVLALADEVIAPCRASVASGRAMPVAPPHRVHKSQDGV
jgi:hypothetical protein